MRMNRHTNNRYEVSREKEEKETKGGWYERVKKMRPRKKAAAAAEPTKSPDPIPPPLRLAWLPDSAAVPWFTQLHHLVRQIKHCTIIVLIIHSRRDIGILFSLPSDVAPHAQAASLRVLVHIWGS